MHSMVNKKRLKINTLLILGSLLGFAQQSVAADSQPERLSPGELVDVVAPIALYPDDLVAVVLPAASYPLQLVQAQRVLDDGGSPDADWDEAVVAVMNYPEVLEFMNADLDWTYGLGLAFINQEADVFNAVQDFRASALAAGNLKSDSYQNVRVDNRGNILIEPRTRDTLYVPYYEPRRVVVRHVAPVYHYYPIARPVYYYPYPANYSFNVGHFYGVGTYFSIGWQYRGLSLFYSNGPSHPYAGRHYAVRYSPRHYHFEPRVRRHAVAKNRHHYKPKYNKRVKHRARQVRNHKKFRPAKHAQQRRADKRHERNREAAAYKRSGRQVAQRRELQKPRHRLARNNLKHEQQRKQAKFRDTRREREKFGRTKLARNDAAQHKPRKRSLSRESRPQARRKAQLQRKVKPQREAKLQRKAQRQGARKAAKPQRQVKRVRVAQKAERRARPQSRNMARANKGRASDRPARNRSRQKSR